MNTTERYKLQIGIDDPYSIIESMIRSNKNSSPEDQAIDNWILSRMKMRELYLKQRNRKAVKDAADEIVDELDKLIEEGFNKK